MFEPGALIVYGSTGICRVEEIAPRQQVGGTGQAMYYTLTPVFGCGTVYTPVDTKVFMRPVMTRQQADELLRRMPGMEECPCAMRDQRALAEHYRGLLHTYECEVLVGMIKTIRAKSLAAAQRGKKLGKIDQQYMKRAEELLCDELSVALCQPKEQVKEYMARQLCAASAAG